MKIFYKYLSFKFLLQNKKMKKTKGCWRGGARRRTPDSSSALLLHFGMALEWKFVSASVPPQLPPEDFQTPECLECPRMKSYELQKKTASGSTRNASRSTRNAAQ